MVAIFSPHRTLVAHAIAIRNNPIAPSHLPIYIYQHRQPLFEKLDPVTAEKVVASETIPVARDSMGPIMHDINFQIRRGALAAVVSRVGEGKSPLVGALLSEMYKSSGQVRPFGSLAYVSQTSWILNATIRENILFGRFYDKGRYLKTIRSCALVPDFKMLVSGDKTGINLSGGQKQRASIARAVYSNADMYILDDPLSAADALVDHHIFKHAFTTIPADKTCILITNGVNHLKEDGLLRTLEAAQGSIVIDGIEISTLVLYELRSRRTVIPQEPFLIDDAIRPNLDPFGKYTDTEIWSALEFASIKS
ncbi:hypothetical protein BGX30_008254 [Mortierella sp. GBA39]|nr:hypothetical protein BGX30_008254 [Mortierella sp. GBA39]